MARTPIDQRAGPRAVRGLVYAKKPVQGQMMALKADFFAPKGAGAPAPLLVWLGADVLSDREMNPKGPQRLAEVLTRKGVALAAPMVRVGATRGDLPYSAIERLGSLEALRDKSVDPDLSTIPTIAATQDICALLAFVAENAEELGLSGQIVLAGASMGAGLAFNVGVVAPALGLDRPTPAGILSYSGACAWPSLYEPGTLRVFALNNPVDPKTPIGPIRAMAEKDPSIELIESMEQAHGSLGLWPQETALQACLRIQTRVIQWCDQQRADA